MNNDLHYAVAGDASECPSPALCPLNQVPAGCSVHIRRLVASPELSQRLREMGLIEDQRVRLISKQNHVICQVCNARLALSSQLAECILVEG